MDVNETRFCLLYGEKNWCDLFTTANKSVLDVHKSNGALILKERSYRFYNRGELTQRDELLTRKDRRGADRDRYGNWYWIAEDEREIRFSSPGSRQFEHFWSVRDNVEKPKGKGRDFSPENLPALPLTMKLRGLAVTADHYLVVGTLDPAGLVIFDLHAGGPPLHMPWPEQVPFHPYDMATRPEGGVWILDVPLPFSEGVECRYWALNREFQIEGINQINDQQSREKGVFHPEREGERRLPDRVFPRELTLDLASPLKDLSPLAIEGLPDDSILILAEGEQCSEVIRYRFAERIGEWALEDLFEIETGEGSTNPFNLKGYDLAFLPGAGWNGVASTGTVYIVGLEGNQVFAFNTSFNQNSFSLDLITEYYPLRRFTGKALVAGRKRPQDKGRTVFYDLNNRWLPVVAHDKPRYHKDGVLLTIIFDGKEPDCIWHRVITDAIIPGGTHLEFASRAANSRELLVNKPWHDEPDPYLRGDGAEIPYYRPFSENQRRREGAGSWELLLQQARGRYLQLRMTLVGTGYSTPEVHALRVYYPRFSYLNEYLPSLYQHDRQSASFLGRFLANVEGMYTTLEGRIAEAQQLFDPRLVPEEYLGWLASWLGIKLDFSWDERRWRLFLSHAVELFCQRGTLPGLIRMIRLGLDPCVDETLFTEPVTGYLNSEKEATKYPFSVRIVERFLVRSAPGVLYGDQRQPDFPRMIEETESWNPHQGAAPLHKHFQKYLQRRMGGKDRAFRYKEDYQEESFNEMKLSPIKPKNEQAAAIWKEFMEHEIGFTYPEITTADEVDYQDFLKHRYRQIDKLNRAYRWTFSGFSSVSLPAANDMPEGGPRLFDWIQFVSFVVPLKRCAHQFTVLVPIDPESDSQSQIISKVSLVKRIVELEKPSHTKFQVKPYWALFRVGETRVGLDTLLGQGSRFVSLVLGQTELAEGYLGSTHPWGVGERIVTGRDQLGSEMLL